MLVAHGHPSAANGQTSQMLQQLLFAVAIIDVSQVVTQILQAGDDPIQVRHISQIHKLEITSTLLLMVPVGKCHQKGCNQQKENGGQGQGL